jgi:SAM-dependent methyltransferase
MDDEPAEIRFDRPESGPTWAERARLEPLAAVLDPADTRGGKNRLIDRVHKLALGRALGDLRGATALDFGCGTGRLSDWLVRRGASVVGVDVTPEMVTVARSNIPHARFETIDGRTLPFADGCFDVVVSAYVLQYYVGGDGSIANELARVVRTGGRLVGIEQVTDGDIGRGGPASAYTEMLESVGFRVLDVSMIRMSDSRILAIEQRLPVFARLPLVPWLMTREAERHARVPLKDGRYADAVFRAIKVDA